MATIDKLQRLIQTKKEIKDAINSRGGSISSLDTFASYPLQILTLSTGTSGVDFSGLGYNYAPQYIVDAIEHSKEYRRDFITKNSSSSTTTIYYDPQLMYFPKVDIDENKDIVFEQPPYFNGELLVSANFCNVLPSLTIFPDLDWKGREIKNSNTSLFSGGDSLQSVHLNNMYVKDLSNLFSNCPSLKDVDISKIVYNKSATTLSGMFNNCENLVEFKFPENFEFNNGVSLSSMFSGCTNIKEIDLSPYNLLKITSLSSTFTKCRYLEYLNLENLNTENLKDLSSFMSQCKSLKEIRGLNDLNTSNVTNISNLFYSSIIDEVDLTGWDVSNVENMSSLFREAIIRRVNLTGWHPLKVNNMSQFFYANYNGAVLEQIEGLGNWDISKVTDISYAFYYQDKLSELDFTNWDFSSVTKASQFLYQCKNLTNVYGPIRGIKFDLNLAYSDKLTTESAMVFINGLEEVDSPKTISFHSKVKNQLTEDQIAIATAKGWTVA